MKKGDRVYFTDKPFLSEGFILNYHYLRGGSSKPYAYTVKLDDKAPNEYAWETDEVLSFGDDIKVINND